LIFFNIIASQLKGTATGVPCYCDACTVKLGIYDEKDKALP